MTIWYVDVMWGVALFAVAFFTAGCVVFNPALRSIRTMGIVAAYGLGLWMVGDLPLVVALATWCVFASLGGSRSCFTSCGPGIAMPAPDARQDHSCWCRAFCCGPE